MFKINKEYKNDENAEHLSDFTHNPGIPVLWFSMLCVPFV